MHLGLMENATRKCGLFAEDIEFIESMIRQMELK